ncbi:pilus assembly protein [Streptomyces beijiangensis]|uniref:Pilus assembly protein n=2 Tax=Streptomyces beijiangensis TaxID=163361 RepID=A0A939JKA0_9ACTN|nr:pilus assembly protein [Streptomyces beijiangensis]
MEDRGFGGSAPERGRTSAAPARRTGWRSDRGTSILEFTGFLPILLFVGMAAIQLGLIGYAANQAGTAARTAARSESLTPGSGQGSGQSAVSSWLNPSVGMAGDGDTVTATATITVPSVLPGINPFGPITRSVTMPTDDRGGTP